MTGKDATSTEERATRAARHPVVLGRVIDLPGGRLEIWRSARRRPALLLPFFVGRDGEIVRVDASWRAFERFLAAAMPDLSDFGVMADLIRAAPGRRILAQDETFVPERYRSTMWQPRIDDSGHFIGYCHDTIHGLWERIEIDAAGKVDRVELGPARKIPLR